MNALVGFIGLVLVLYLIRSPSIAFSVRAIAACLCLGFASALTTKLYGFSASQMALAACAVLLLLSSVQKRQAMARFNMVDILQLLLVMGLLAKLVFLGGQPPLALAQASGVLFMLVFAKALPPMTDRDQNRLLEAVSLGGLVVAGVCFVQYLLSPGLYGLIDLPPSYEQGLVKRVTGLYGNPNAAAFYLCVSFATMLVRLRSQAGGQRLFGVVCLAAVGLAIILTQSRAGLIALFVIGGLEFRRFVAQNARAGAAVVSVLAAVAVYAMQSGSVLGALFPDRMSEQLTRDEERAKRFEQAQRIIDRYPFTGDAEATFSGERANYHNDLIQITADHGLLVGTLFALLLCAMLVAVRRSCRMSQQPIHQAAAYVVYVGVIISLTHNIISSGLVFWLIVGIALSQPCRKLNAQVHRGDRSDELQLNWRLSA